MTPDRWEEINHLYNAIIEVNEDERTTFLEMACEADAELRREVDSLLAYDQPAQQLLDRSALRLTAEKLAAEPVSLLGRKLGPYQIEAVLGVGGMGEVFKARDTRLNRTVAIKVLPEYLSEQADLRRRFEREARAIAGLDHPHVCALYDIGNEDQIDFLVMEYLEGETLSKRLKKGPLPAAQVLRYSIEIASALDQAHRQGFVHRDLKPGNIMLTKNGAKLLDFGLAKSGRAVSPKPPASEGATDDLHTARSASAPYLSQSESLTEEGMILGTLEYMAPEQVEGKEVDVRTDIFAFGVVLYEMATGWNPFEGESKASLTAAILTAEPPPISRIQPMTPPALDHVVKRCLAKDPDERWQSAGDLTNELKWIAEDSSRVGAPVVAATNRKKRERLVWSAVSVLLFGLGLIIGIYYLHQQPVRRGALHFTLPPPKQVNSLGYDIAISPDGGQLAINDRRFIWICPLNSSEALQLAGTENAGTLFWSPDSRFIGFSQQGKLMKVKATGGNPQVICDIGRPIESAAWNRQGIILFGHIQSGGIWRISAEGGKPLQVTKLDKARQEYSHTWPCWLPDSRHFLYTVRSSLAESRGIYWGSLDSKESKRLVDVDSNALYASPGYLLYQRDRKLLAHPFDIKYLNILGDPVSIAEELTLSQSANAGIFTVSENRTLLYWAGGVSQQLSQVDRNGRTIDRIGPPGEYRALELSPNGRQIAMVQLKAESSTGETWIIDLLRGGTKTQLTSSTGSEYDEYARWSPDGKRILFASNRDQFSGLSDSSAGNLYVKDLNGSPSQSPLFRSSQFKLPSDWSRDEHYILYHNADSPDTSLWRLPLFGERKPELFLGSAIDGRFSPNGKWVAYSSHNEVYVRTFPLSEKKWLVSTRGGNQPLWRKDGKELFYVEPSGRLMSVDVQSGTTTVFQHGVPQALFEVKNLEEGGRGIYRYAVSPDGQSFYVLTKDSSSLQLNGALNWTADLPGM